MLFGILKRLIERGLTDGLYEKIDVFYALNKLIKEEYEKLYALFDATNNTEEGEETK